MKKNPRLVLLRRQNNRTLTNYTCTTLTMLELKINIITHTLGSMINVIALYLPHKAHSHVKVTLGQAKIIKCTGINFLQLGSPNHLGNAIGEDLYFKAFSNSTLLYKTHPWIASMLVGLIQLPILTPYEGYYSCLESWLYPVLQTHASRCT
jgi:hypothetical protein